MVRCVEKSVFYLGNCSDSFWFQSIPKTHGWDAQKCRNRSLLHEGASSRKVECAAKAAFYMGCAPIHFKQKIFQRPKAATVMCARKIVFCMGEFPDSFGFGIEYIPKNHDWDCKKCRNTVNGRTWKDILGSRHAIGTWASIKFRKSRLYEKYP